MKSEKRSSISIRIRRVTMILMAISLLIVGVGASYINLLSAMKTSQKTFTNIVDAAIVAIEMEVDAITNIVQEMGTNPTLYDDSVDKDTVEHYLQNKANLYDYEAFYVTDVNGISNTGFDFSSHEFFKVAINGGLYFSEPIATNDGRMTNIMVSAPIWRDGVYGGEVKGIVCAVIDGKLLSDLVTQIHIGETGRLYIINSEGYTIADVDYNTVLNRENTILESQHNSELLLCANAEKAALNGVGTFTQMRLYGQSQFLYVAPLADTGFVVGGMAQMTEYIGANIRVACTVAAITVLTIALSWWLINEFSKRLTNPIIAIAKTSQQVAEGNYTIEDIKTKNDEVGDMAHSFQTMVHANQEVISDVVRCLNALAQGDFTVKPNAKYPGIFKSIEDAINGIATSMNTVMVKINDCSEQVNLEASQIANAASSLSQGSSEQAATIEELAATIHGINEQVKENADTSREAHDLVVGVRTGIEESNNMMHTLNGAIHTIEKRATDINNVVKTIDDIAFQTNILAINASIEAARAGSAGRGFAVVADEVRNLAAKCAESVKTTEELINASNSAIHTGSTLADETMKVLQDVVDKTIKVTEMVIAISEACIDQSNKIAETTVGIEQVSHVVQSNSAVAEESSAASDELAEQAARLQSILTKFKV